jgi:hypothetical protein
MRLKTTPRLLMKKQVVMESGAMKRRGSTSSGVLSERLQ